MLHTAQDLFTVPARLSCPLMRSSGLSLHVTHGKQPHDDNRAIAKGDWGRTDRTSAPLYVLEPERVQIEKRGRPASCEKLKADGGVQQQKLAKGEEARKSMNWVGTGPAHKSAKYSNMHSAPHVA